MKRNSKIKENRNILFFDGVCTLCNKTIDFFIKRNDRNTIFYASLQSKFAKDFLRTQAIDSNKMETILYFSKGKLHTKSSAVLIAVKELSSIHRGFFLLLIIPKFIRDYFYDIIATKRYRLFGKSTTCRIPNESEIKRFISE
ncbi:putative DCC family thiol-disulfide oxidoreductase YuxK [Lutibacter sp. Hel_I_33_5]|uniref:thiol-disulfide oxidoreductase DCC family protein n=1 Tax=Lutibacter sp. Hel_I_33_5 TaxID=1566289 RepID=UPI00119FAF42|nr:DUF393 domain-containing protein [Lutibacter sp. Hel_I_33_5]TVZ54896.1 putative DCC family thiol-disulfide oxidoreductase YuxK [Lutibacter sp. Hel_I_33_5]